MEIKSEFNQLCEPIKETSISIYVASMLIFNVDWICQNSHCGYSTKQIPKVQWMLMETIK